MKEIALRMKESLKYQVIKDLVDHPDSNGRISVERKRRAGLRLQLSLRQVNRLIAKIKETGKTAFLHGNRDKAPVNKLDQSVSERIIALYREKYQALDTNFSHFRDLLEKREGISVSYTLIRGLLLARGILSPKSQRKTRKRVRMEELMRKRPEADVAEIEAEASAEIARESSHPRREKSKYFGEIIEMDASSHVWFGEERNTLHLSVDDATGTVTGGYFDREETLYGYYRLFESILRTYGIPYSFLTDRRTVFEYERKSRKDEEKDTMTQFSYACTRLGTSIRTTSVPEAKGAIERLNGSFQSRLSVELKLEGITTLDEANRYLRDTFIPDYNSRFARNPKDYESVFVGKVSDIEINEALSVISRRVVDNGNSIRYEKRYYAICDGSTRKYYSKGTKVLVIRTLDGQLLASVEGVVFNLVEIRLNKTSSPE
ncbi:MAG: ISNCY family transposase, partial [Bacteroidales bacterium]|nr:ISNCY family transposase [Bacteroidales bacterium]